MKMVNGKKGTAAIQHSANPVFLMLEVVSDCAVFIIKNVHTTSDMTDESARLGERLAHPRREWKPEFKQERYPPLDGAACSLVDFGMMKPAIGQRKKNSPIPPKQAIKSHVRRTLSICVMVFLPSVAIQTKLS